MSTSRYCRYREKFAHHSFDISLTSSDVCLQTNCDSKRGPSGYCSERKALNQVTLPETKLKERHADSSPVPSPGSESSENDSPIYLEGSDSPPRIGWHDSNSDSGSGSGSDSD